MKIPRHLILITFILSALLFSCDVIDEPFLREGVQPPPDTAACPIPDFPEVPVAVQNVLLEDYTGHRCVNCPQAAIQAHDLVASWGGRLKLVAVHAGLFAAYVSAPYTANYTTPAGDAWDQTFGVSNVGNPNGLINRTGFSQNHIVSPSNWAGRIQDAMQQTPEVMLQVITDYSPAERKLCAHVRATWLQDMQDNINLLLIILEDSIVSPQKNNNPQVGPVPDIMDYTHMHVMRHAMNGIWGRPIISADSLTSAGSQIIHTYRYDLPETWVAEHCGVIAFVYRTSDYQILQVEDAKVTKD